MGVCIACIQNAQELQITFCHYFSYNPFQHTKNLPIENAKQSKLI